MLLLQQQIALCCRDPVQQEVFYVLFDDWIQSNVKNTRDEFIYKQNNLSEKRKKWNKYWLAGISLFIFISLLLLLGAFFSAPSVSFRIASSCIQVGESLQIDNLTSVSWPGNLTRFVWEIDEVGNPKQITKD